MRLALASRRIDPLSNSGTFYLLFGLHYRWDLALQVGIALSCTGNIVGVIGVIGVIGIIGVIGVVGVDALRCHYCWR